MTSPQSLPPDTGSSAAPSKADPAPTTAGTAEVGTAEVGTAPPSNVTRLSHQGKDIYLIGTAHISQRSVEEVQRVIRQVKPSTVCVELDEMRYETMLDGNRFRNLDIFQVIKQKKVLFLLSSLVLSSFQRKMGERLGVRPGAELLTAIETAKEIGAEVVLADRNVQATLKRSWANLGFLDKVRLIGVLFGGFFASHEISEEQVEQLKERDTINEAMTEFARHMPRLQVPLIDERDRYLMSRIQEAPGPTIVGVVGAAHVSGMTQYLGASIDRVELSTIPKPTFLSQAVKWIIPAIILFAFYFGWREHRGEGLQQMLYAWVIPNAVGAALLSALAGARPLTVVVAGVASPITSLNPTIGAGIVAGLVEAWLRKPNVADCEGINDAMLSLGSMYRNRFTRVLLVAVGATLGSALGAWVGAAWVVQLL